MFQQMDKNRKRKEALMPARNVSQHVRRLMRCCRISVPVVPIDLFGQIKCVAFSAIYAVQIDTVHIPVVVMISVLFQQAIVDLPASVVLFRFRLRGDFIRPFPPGPDFDVFE